MKRLFLTLLTCVFALVSQAQEWKDPWVDHIWTNGSEMLVSVPIANNQVLLVANSYYDAGYGYLLQTKKTGNYQYDMKSVQNTLSTSQLSNLDEVAKMILESGSTNSDDDGYWRRKDVGNYNLLIRYHANHTVSSVYEETGREMREVAVDAMMTMIAGSYTTTRGVEYRFSDDGSCIFNGKPATYYIVSDDGTDAPDYTIVIGSRIWQLVPTIEGMKIYLAERNDDGDLIRKNLYASLKASTRAPRWQFTSDRPVCYYAANSLPDHSVLRLMRNEIYARHGYTFSDPQLKDYFQSCSWYKPIGDNTKVRLSDMELLNVAILKALE